MIKSKDISVVVQGPIYKNETNICLKSIRKYLPGAEIILSTWQDSDVSGLDYDVLLLNQDPGFTYTTKERTIANNCNRQIVSTKNGLKVASRKYALKIRTDFEIVNTNFIKYFGKFKKYNESYKFLKERVVQGNAFVRDPELKWKAVLHPADWWWFGLTEDLLDIYDIRLQTEKDTNYFDDGLLWQFPPEQYIWIEFLKKHGLDCKCKSYKHCSPYLIDETYKTFVNNLIIIEQNECGIKELKPDAIHNYEGLLTYKKYLELYKTYCDPKFKMPLRFIDKSEILGIKKYKNKLKKHYDAFRKPLKQSLHWLSEGGSVVGYSMKTIGKIILSTPKLFMEEKRLIHDPYGIIIDTTALCNNCCSFCWRSNYPDRVKEISTKYQNNHTMPFKTYKKIIDDICQYDSVRWLSWSGPMGEPLMNDRIEDFFEYAYKKHHFYKISINSNGLALNKRNIGRLLNNCTEFSVSFDSINPEIYEKIHGHKNMQQVIENIKAMVVYKKEHGAVAEIRVRFTENELNAGQFPEFKKFFDEIGVDFVNHVTAHAFAGVKKELQSFETASECDQYMKIVNFDFLGNLSACHLNWHMTPTFGNIKDHTIKELWESPEKLNWNCNRLTYPPCGTCSGLGIKVQKRGLL